MKREFTKLMAALALLLFIAPLGMWGQTSSTTETLTISSYASANNWTNGNAYTPISTEHVTISGKTNGNNSKYYSSNGSWRHYEGDSGEITVAISSEYISDYTLSSVKFNYSNGNNGVIQDGSTNVTSGTSYSVSGTSKTFSVGHSSGTKNGNVQITSIEIVFESTGGAATTYTVTYDGNGNDSGSAPTDGNSPYNSGTTVTVLGNTGNLAKTGYTWAGWNTASDGTGTSYAAGATFSISSNTTLYARWIVNGSVTVTLNIEEYADDNNWNNSTQYTTAIVTPVTFTANGGSNTGKYYTSGEEWRFYQTENASITISVPSGYHLVSITPTYNVTNTGVLLSGTTQLASGSPVSASGTSVTYTVGNSGSANNGQVKFTNIDVIYAPDATITPVIIANPATLNDFFYLTSHGPSAAQTVSVSGVQLTNGITVALGNNSNFEISQTENSGYTNSITLAQSNGSVASTTIYVRMKGNLQAGNYSDNLSLTSTGATTITLALAGEVVTPMTVAQAITAIDEATGNTVSGVYVTGIVSQIDSYNSSYHSITYWISDDGGTTTQLEVFGGKGLNGDNFSEITDLTLGDEVVVYGNLKLYDETVYEFESNNHLVYLNHTVVPVINANDITMAYNETEGTISYEVVHHEDGTILIPSCSASWISSFTVNANANTVTFYATQNDNQAARTATITLSYTGAADKVITVTQNAFTASSGSGSGQFARINDPRELTDGCRVIIASRYDNNANAYKAMPNVLATNTNHGRPTGVAFTSTTQGGDEFLPATIANDYSSYCWTVNITNDGYTFTRADGQILGWTSGTDFSYANGIHRDWTIERITSGSAAMVPNYTGFLISNVNTTTRAFAYNGNEFGVYSTTNSLNTSGYSYHLDFFVETNATVRYTFEIEHYTESGVGQNVAPSNKWYLIASPVQGVTPSAANGFLTSAYDLYRFDQVGDAEGNEWLNYEVTPFNLISGQGYLYASSTDTELEFEGAPYMGNGQVTLYKKDCSNASGNFEGWNLVGNPFAQTAYIDRDCYVMNENRNQIVAGTSRQVAAMEGVFVIAASDGETMTFSTTAPGKADSKVVMNVIDNQGVADRAIVRFGEGRQLPKFQLKGNATKVYFQQGQEEFAIVAAENEGELPVNFKASRNGRYTMSFDVENLDMTYLHLIDNKTGNDVDLLQTPSYTFQANSSDYESRFRLVFDANTVNENNTTTTFAYFNGTEWVVNNNGNATLQVIDMMGRVLSSETLNGNANVTLNQAAGIYMLRLVNGENVMVQKVVVR